MCLFWTKKTCQLERISLLLHRESASVSTQITVTGLLSAFSMTYEGRSTLTVATSRLRVASSGTRLDVRAMANDIGKLAARTARKAPMQTDTKSPEDSRLNFTGLLSAVEFNQEYQCEHFAVDPLMEYGLRYHRECEEYDAIVCVRKNHRGFGMPEGPERLLVNRNAMLVRRRLANELIEAGLATEEDAIGKMRDAIAMAGEPFRREWDRVRAGR